MLYDDLIAYDQAAVSYDGTVILKIRGILNPIILNNIRINYGGLEDYSVATTIGVISIDVEPSGIITIETFRNEGAALIQASQINIHSGNLVSIN